MSYSFSNNEFTITVSKDQYNSSVIHKCFYWYTGRFVVHIEESEYNWFVTIGPKSNQFDENSLQKLKEKISQDLIDFKLRDIVFQETQTIRELLLAKAFANYEIGDDPITDVSDPVGFKPEDLSIHDQSNTSD